MHKRDRLTVDALELRVLMEPCDAQLAPKAAAAETAARHAANTTIHALRSLAQAQSMKGTFAVAKLINWHSPADRRHRWGPHS